MRAKLATTAGLSLVAAAAAACSGGGYGAAPGTGGGSTASSAARVTVETSTGQFGTYLTDGSGRTLYLWVKDGKGSSACSGACAAAWPPLETLGDPNASGKAMGSLLGTTTRDDGSMQVTYEGHPLYYYASDTGAGDVKGQGSDGFGAKWWVVSPSGAAITTGTGSGSDGGGYGGY